jgi:hypothetical protein
MAQIFWTLVYAVMVGLWVSFLLLLAYKIGIVEWLQVHGGDFISKMAHCDFCMSWWLSVLVTLIIFCFLGDSSLISVPFLATPIARRLL